MDSSAARSAEFRAWKAPTHEVLAGWIGWRVSDVNGSAIGHVESIRRDEVDPPGWLVVSEFRFGDGRRFLIPIKDAVGGGGHVWSPHERNHIRLTARIIGPRMTRQALRRLRAHYLNAPRAA